jgi:type I restriction enzyme R subunit
MVFYAAKAVQAFGNPTIIVLTDRNDLDEQLYGTFAKSEAILRQTPRQATSRAKLRELLTVDRRDISPKYISFHP